MTLQEKLYHQRQLANAIQRHEEFYRLDTKPYPTHIMLPTPQTSGTMTQQRTYAMDKAMQIVESI